MTEHFRVSLKQIISGGLGWTSGASDLFLTRHLKCPNRHFFRRSIRAWGYSTIQRRIRSEERMTPELYFMVLTSDFQSVLSFLLIEKKELNKRSRLTEKMTVHFRVSLKQIISGGLWCSSGIPDLFSTRHLKCSNRHFFRRSVRAAANWQVKRHPEMDRIRLTHLRKYRGLWKHETPFKTGSDGVGRRFCGAPFSFCPFSLGRARENGQVELSLYHERVECSFFSLERKERTK